MEKGLWSPATRASRASWLCLWLRQLNATVIGFSTDSAPRETERNFRLCRLADQITHTTGDIRSAETVATAIAASQAEIIFHLAAQPLVSVSYEQPKLTFETNFGGVVNVLDAARRCDSVRAIVVITTDKVYRNREWTYPYRECDELGGHDPYSASKAAAELAVASYRDSWGGFGVNSRPVAIATARGGNVIGGGDFSRDRLIPDCMRALLQGKQINLRSPRAVRPWQHVLDLLSGYLQLGAALLRSPEEFHRAWNFGPFDTTDVDCETVVQRIIALWGAGSYAAQSGSDAFHETGMLRLDSSLGSL